jgi:hypothetical protein
VGIKTTVLTTLACAGYCESMGNERPKNALKRKNAVKEAGATDYILLMASRDSDSDIAFDFPFAWLHLMITT